MLVLTRRIGEEIVIDGDIRLTVLAVKGRRVRLGIIAPSSTQVRREELPRNNGQHAAAPGHPTNHTDQRPCAPG